jgi:hypothetical protein
LLVNCIFLKKNSPGEGGAEKRATEGERELQLEPGDPAINVCPAIFKQAHTPKIGGLTALAHQESQTRILGTENHPVPVFPKLP